MMKRKFKFGLVLLSSLCLFLSFGYCDYLLFAGQTETNVSGKGTATCQASSPILCLKGGGSVNFGTNGMANLDNNNLVCFSSDNGLSTVSVNYDIWYGGTITCQGTTNSNMTESQCISMYGLVSSSDYNTLSGSFATCQSNLNNCQNNSSDCSVTESLLESCNTDLNSCLNGALSGNSWSALYINDIQHLGAPIINITIPEEYSWDYTGDENTFDLDIEGYNVDYEYIDNIIRTQKSVPSSDDFNSIVSGLIPLLIPGLVIILFLIFIFKFVKKIF